MLDLEPETLASLWQHLSQLTAELARERGSGALTASQGVGAFQQGIAAFDFQVPMDPAAAFQLAVAGLDQGCVRTDDRRYFGPFQPAPSHMAILGQALAGACNPQLATHNHAPWPIELEQHLLRFFGERFGLVSSEVDGAFTSGGAEANLTAVFVALCQAFPQLTARGLRALPGQPTMYTSAEAHPTLVRAAQITGLGSDAVRLVPVDAQARLKTAVLRRTLADDRRSGAIPFLIVATAGTTSTGTIEPLNEMADIAAEAGCWLHVDAAWGGLAAWLPELRDTLRGIERADSITFDPHKALPVPLGVGTLLLRRRGMLEGAFAPGRSGYMPRRSARDPYARAIPWSRRFLGLPIFLSLAVAGVEGVATMLRKQVALADRLRARLGASRWSIREDTRLPVVCFVDSRRQDGAFLEAMVRASLAAGVGWLSVTRLSNGGRWLRVCVNNHRTEERDIDALATVLDRAREKFMHAVI